MTSFLCSGSSTDGSHRPGVLDNCRDLTSRVLIMMVKVLFLERHFLKNILILCNLKDMHFFSIISIFLSSRENGCFTV